MIYMKYIILLYCIITFFSFIVYQYYMKYYMTALILIYHYQSFLWLYIIYETLYMIYMKDIILLYYMKDCIVFYHYFFYCISITARHITRCNGQDKKVRHQHSSGRAELYKPAVNPLPTQPFSDLHSSWLETPRWCADGGRDETTGLDEKTCVCVCVCRPMFCGETCLGSCMVCCRFMSMSWLICFALMLYLRSLVSNSENLA